MTRSCVRVLAAGVLLFAGALAVAQGKIADESTIALVVNSARERTQDQLHVHLVRLRDNAT